MRSEFVRGVAVGLGVSTLAWVALFLIVYVVLR
jgi:hypothetical protein